MLRYQRNIVGVSSDNYGGFLCHVGGKASPFQVTVARQHYSQVPNILQIQETCLPDSENFHYYTNFYLLVDLYTDIDMQNVFFLSVSG